MAYLITATHPNHASRLILSDEAPTVLQTGWVVVEKPRVQDCWRPSGKVEKGDFEQSKQIMLPPTSVFSIEVVTEEY